MLLLPKAREALAVNAGESLGIHERMRCPCDSFILANQISSFNKYPNLRIISSSNIQFSVIKWRPFVADVPSESFRWPTVTFYLSF